MYHRHAQYSLGDFKAAASAFERGLQLEPANASLKSGLQNARARITDDDAQPEERTPSAPGPGAGLGGMADMLRGMGGGAGGMPDIASMMNNPQLMAMAQQMMANGGLANLMQNPAVANMVSFILSSQSDFVMTDRVDESRSIRKYAIDGRTHGRSYHATAVSCWSDLVPMSC